MTVDPCDPFVMPVSKNPLGLTDVPVFVDRASAELDVGPDVAVQHDFALACKGGGTEGL